MKPIKTYSTRLEADVAKIALDAVGIDSMVIGVDVGMQGGVAGVQLLVPDDQVEAAQAVLEKA